MEPKPTAEENLLEAALSLKQGTQKHKKHFRASMLGRLYVAGAIIVGTWAGICEVKANALISRVIEWTMALSLPVFRFSFFDRNRKKQMADYHSALLRMAKSDDTNAVGMLLEEVYHYDFDLRQEIRAALMRLLPRLQTENAPALDASQRKTLAYLPFVTEKVNPNLRLAALQAIAQVGDAEALRVAKKNRDSTGQEHGTELRSPTGGMQQKRVQIKINKIRSDMSNANLDYASHFRSAVADCIAKLEARLARENAAETLLRASRAENAAPETLLRPATNTETHSAVLLRPAHRVENYEDK